MKLYGSLLTVRLCFISLGIEPPNYHEGGVFHVYWCCRRRGSAVSDS